MNLIGILGIIFIVLKLVDVIDWSWFWVLSPYLIGVSIYAIIYIIIRIKLSRKFK